MPVWLLEHLALVAAWENVIDREALEKQYFIFDGIIGRTLEYNKQRSKKHREGLDGRIPLVSVDVLRSIHAGVDDNSDAETKNNMSGFIVAYDNIPFEGEDAFTETDLTMTSEYARMKARYKLCFENPRKHAEMLLKCLDKQARDITGIDLEVPAAHMVASGSRTVKWEYNAVGGPSDRPAVLQLKLTKKEVHRGVEIDESKLNYPADATFGLVDFFVFIHGEC